MVSGLLELAAFLTAAPVGLAASAHNGHPARTSGCGRPAKGTVAPGTEATRSISVGGITESYELAMPRGYRSVRPYPLILLFYGYGSNAAQFSTLTGMPRRGASQGYLVAVPSARSVEWQFAPRGSDASDVTALIDTLSSLYCIDRHRIYAAGFSAGAAFTIVYSCAHEDRIAAIATVAVEFQLGCTRPMSILAFHGTKDPLVPYENNATGLSLPGVRVRGTQLNMGDWARLGRCRPVAGVQRVGSEVLRQAWTGCSNSTGVVLYTILGGSHSWPGADPRKSVGLTTNQISATAKILVFFRQHHR